MLYDGSQLYGSNSLVKNVLTPFDGDAENYLLNSSMYLQIASTNIYNDQPPKIEVSF